MNAARISPAANLLRNSRLFALPPAVTLPSPEPSSEPVPRSDTATSLYPISAAIETPQPSLNRGDWGLKRSLPLKSTLKSGSPSIRLNGAIDTAFHVADFDSAADHVLTLQKFQELNQDLTIASPRNNQINKTPNAFARIIDNTTATSRSATGKNKYTGVWPDVHPSVARTGVPNDIKSRLSQLGQPVPRAAASTTDIGSTSGKSKRWRFDGPSLVQLSGLEFDNWLKKLNTDKLEAFRDFVRSHLVAEKQAQATVLARETADWDKYDQNAAEVGDEELSEYIRQLRQRPRTFGPLLARFLDLPAGPEPNSRTGQSDEPWTYFTQGQESNLPSDYYRESGPPRTHPSAGLSYIHSRGHIKNHAIFGPQDQNQPVVGRAVKTRTSKARSGGSSMINRSDFGVAGFIVNQIEDVSDLERSSVGGFELRDGGNKIALVPKRANFTEHGALQLQVGFKREYVVQDNKAVHYSMGREQQRESLPSRYGVSAPQRPRANPSSSAPRVKKAEQMEPLGGDADAIFAQLNQQLRAESSR